ncbi:MAG: CRISPR-associated helicase Cas3' [Acidobacteriota bacterium]|nr:CRISPR-associated helicase Cas3' [Acidobacteriota bacterium]
MQRPRNKKGDSPPSASKALLPGLGECLAKTQQTSRGVEPGHTVLDHCEIVGRIARELLGRIPNDLRRALFPDGVELVAAAHDVGKISPTFQLKIRRAIAGADHTPAEYRQVAHVRESDWGGHPGVSQLTLEAIGTGRFIPRIAGLHHGYSPRVEGKLATDSVFGGPLWQEIRETLIAKLKQQLDCDWPQIRDENQARVVAGLTTVADWIGSGSLLEAPLSNWSDRIAPAVDKAGFVIPQTIEGLSFESIFGFPPRESQTRFYEHACRPGVFVLEAPMGVGKTEAALYAAYLALASNQATGLYFALPTQITSERIHERVTAFLDRILALDSNHRLPRLLHGDAWLKAVEIGEEGQPGQSWFDARKRGILAPFAVGTIDQALMAVMNVRHGFVRAFGLAGKVVILDEVHSYDAYTGLLLDELVATLRQLRCTVIILSATLSAERRQALLQQAVHQRHYPLVTARPDDVETLLELPLCGLDDRSVRLQFEAADTPAIEEALHRAAAGQQVLWIENTVTEAQGQHALLAARAVEVGIECGLLHSRFTRADRQRNEGYWVALYGKARGKGRASHGRILVGTQVLEQSLDIDADFLVTRFAPSDMLLQRLGRLWRHADTPRPCQARREAWLLAPRLAEAREDPSAVFGRTACVYAPYVLYRSLEVWSTREQVSLPGDIRDLIEATYRERPETGGMARALHELEHGSRHRMGRQQLRQLARRGLAYIGPTQSDEKAPTRYSDRDSVDVLLLRAVRPHHKRRGMQVTLVDGETLFLPHDPRRDGHRAWRQRAAALQRQLVRVPPGQAPDSVDRRCLHWLGSYHYLGSREQDNAHLRVALVAPDGELRALSGAPANADWRLSYDDRRGYVAEKSIP